MNKNGFKLFFYLCSINVINKMNKSNYKLNLFKITIYIVLTTYKIKIELILINILH